MEFPRKSNTKGQVKVAQVTCSTLGRFKTYLVVYTFFYPCYGMSSVIVLTS